MQQLQMIISALWRDNLKESAKKTFRMIVRSELSDGKTAPNWSVPGTWKVEGLGTYTGAAGGDRSANDAGW